MPYTITGTRSAQQDSTQSTQMSGMFNGGGTVTSTGVGDTANTASMKARSQGNSGTPPSGSMNQAYANPIRRPGQSMRRM